MNDMYIFILILYSICMSYVTLDGVIYLDLYRFRLLWLFSEHLVMRLKSCFRLVDL